MTSLEALERVLVASSSQDDLVAAWDVVHAAFVNADSRSDGEPRALIKLAQRGRPAVAHRGAHFRERDLEVVLQLAGVRDVAVDSLFELELVLLTLLDDFRLSGCGGSFNLSLTGCLRK